jgi:two-component system, repressor protein LuxO
VKGAFTGATTDRKGAATQAHGGTLFLDEIGEMDIALQSKMLRFLQDKSVRRVGDDVARPVDVRIVCATNRDKTLQPLDNPFGPRLSPIWIKRRAAIAAR